MLQDLKNACRALLKTPWFTSVVVLTLALGIGANTAIFGVVNRLLLNPFPYPDADRIVLLHFGNEQRMTFAVDRFLARIWRDQARTLDGVEGYQFRGDSLAFDASGARVLPALAITPGLPAFLGVAPVLGRGFTADDAAPGAPAVVLLSYDMWQREYGGAHDVLGRAIRLDDVFHTIIGVLPARWDAFRPIRLGPDVWFPLSLDPAFDSAPGNRSVELFGRLRRGVAVDAVRTELDGLLARALAEAPERRLPLPDVTARIDRAGNLLFAASTRDALLLLFGAVGLVLIVACSNVANLLLARGASRARDLALRSALGASSWRLVRALFAECCVLAIAAGALGVGVGRLTLAAFVWLRPSLPALVDVELDTRVLAFTFGISALTALLFGLAPALQLASRDVGGALRHGAAGVVRGGGAHLRKALVAAQMALSVILLVGGGLLVRSVVYLQQIDAGYDTSNLFSVQLSLPRAGYQAPASREAVAEELLARVRSLPGVTAATRAFQAPPYFSGWAGPIEARGAAPLPGDPMAGVSTNYVPPEYFNVLGMPLREGRTFTPDEVRGGQVVIVSRAAAQRFWPAGDAIGAEIKLQEWATVVGVVDDVVVGGPMQPKDVPQFYFPYHADRVPVIGPVLIVRAAEDSGSAIAAVRAATQALDREVALRNVRVTEAELSGSLEGPRFNMALLMGFAVIALTLAAVGLAAVIGYEVTERTREFGIRMALGARTESVRRLAMKHGLTPAFIGVVAGVIGALGATQLATSLLHGVAPRDPLTFVSVVVGLVLVAFGASWLPARRATRVDPITALRAE
jgi:putative ABC transport system permease protein